MSLEITHQTFADRPDAAEIDLTGTMEIADVEFFQSQIMDFINDGHVHLIFDCAALESMDSMGLGSMAYIRKTLDVKGGDMKFQNLSDSIKNMFINLGFGDFLDESAFPMAVVCLQCGRKLKCPGHGRFRCPECKNILVI
ncbi:MAG: STAS domain-containing protein [Spirochaetia bacterium]|nr:STAS domain-containing protein [Spirochaetia bacterium]